MKVSFTDVYHSSQRIQYMGAILPKTVLYYNIKDQDNKIDRDRCDHDLDIKIVKALGSYNALGSICRDNKISATTGPR